jgi:3-oxoacyl-[acyl-carrier protein] reductase
MELQLKGRAEASRRGWGEGWRAIEASVLAEILNNPTGRLGRPEEVADLVAFVASPLAGYINGANLWIHGGSTAVTEPERQYWHALHAAR